MTKEQIAAIELRLHNATPWTWVLEGDGECISDWFLVYGVDDTTIVGQAPDGDDYGGVVSKKEDAELIANAPADIAALLEERKVLIGLLDEASQAIAAFAFPITWSARTWTMSDLQEIHGRIGEAMGK